MQATAAAAGESSSPATLPLSAAPGALLSWLPLVVFKARLSFPDSGSNPPTYYILLSTFVLVYSISYQ